MIKLSDLETLGDDASTSCSHEMFMGNLKIKLLIKSEQPGVLVITENFSTFSSTGQNRLINDVRI